MVKSGTGTWLLAGASSYTGGTTVSAGTLKAGVANSAFGSISSAMTVAGGAIVDVNGFSTLLGSLSGAGTVQNGSATPTTMNAGYNGSSTIFSGVMQNGTGVFSFAKQGGGTLTLSGSNTFTGGVFIAAGILSVSSLADGGVASGIGAGSTGATSLTLSGGTLQYTGGGTSTNRLFSAGTSGGTIDASGSGALNFTGTGGMGFNSQTGARTLTLTGTNTGANTLAAIVGDNGGATSLTKSGVGSWVLTGANTYSGATTISAGILQTNSGAGLGSSSVSLAFGSNIVLNAGSGGYVFNNTIAGNGTITKSGAGFVTLQSSNFSFSGSIVVSAGLFSPGTPNSFGVAPAMTVTAGATVQLGMTLAGGIGSLSGGGIIQNGAPSAIFLAISETTSTTFSGVIQDGVGGGALSISKNGAGTLTFTGGNTYTGTTGVNAGTLQIGNGGTTGTLGTGSVANTGALIINRSDAVTISNTISSSGSLTQAGAGATTLSGTNSYTGATIINAGTLSVSTLANGGSNSNIGAATNAATSLVLDGGTLQYTSSTTVSTDRLFSVGTSGGTISLSGNGIVNFTNTGSMGFNGQSGARTFTFSNTGFGSPATSPSSSETMEAPLRS